MAPAVVFLDVDGVLHPARPGRRAGGRFRPGPMAALGRLLNRASACGCAQPTQVVLSSSWRLSEAGVRAVDDALAAAGLPTSAGRTPISRACGARPRELLAWLDEHPPRRAWVALDDIDLPRAARPGRERARLQGRCVKTDPDVGLTQGDAEAALRILGRGAEGGDCRGSQREGQGGSEAGDQGEGGEWGMGGLAAIG